MGDYRKFLGRTESMVLPYLGGRSVDAKDRRLKLAREPDAEGWWRFEVSGRTATPKERAEPELEGLPAVRGHLAGGFLFAGGAQSQLVSMLTILGEEPPALAPATTRRWHSGDLLFDSLDFETEVEASARAALEDGRPLGDLKGVPASLRAAFGFAVFAAASRAIGVTASPLEVRDRIHDVSRGGRAEAERILRALHANRVAQAVAHRARAHAQAAAERARHATRANLPDRAEAALDAAGARLLSLRVLNAEQAEVRFAFMGNRFVCIVDVLTLNIHDAGICLRGTDRELTLESLPSVIREAIDVDHLNITRR